MDSKEWILTLGIIILAVVMIVYYTKSKRRISKFLFGTLSGIGLLFPAQWILGALEVEFSINFFTGSVAAVLGMPGVVLLAASCFL